MIKRVGVGVAAAALFSLGAGVAPADTAEGGTARPAGDGTYVPGAVPAVRGPSVPPVYQSAWINHEEHRVLTVGSSGSAPRTAVEAAGPVTPEACTSTPMGCI